MNESTFQVSDRQLFIALKAGDERAWREIYSQHREAIIRFVIFHHGCRQEGEDIFREALTVFYEKINHAKFRFTAKIRTYLTAISRNLWSKKLKERGIEMILPNRFESNLNFYDHENYEMQSNNRIEKIIHALEEMPGDNRELLFAWYYHHLSPPIIQELMGFASVESAVSKKNTCIRTLKTLVLST